MYKKQEKGVNMKKQFLIVSLLSITATSLYSGERYPRSITLGSAASVITRKELGQKQARATQDDELDDKLRKTLEDASRDSVLPEDISTGLFGKGLSSRLRTTVDALITLHKKQELFVPEQQLGSIERCIEECAAKPDNNDMQKYALLLAKATFNSSGSTNFTDFIEQAALAQGKKELDSIHKELNDIMARINVLSSKALDQEKALFYFLNQAKQERTRSIAGRDIESHTVKEKIRKNSKTENNIEQVEILIKGRVILSQAFSTLKRLTEEEKHNIDTLMQPEEAAAAADSEHSQD